MWIGCHSVNGRENGQSGTKVEVLFFFVSSHASKPLWSHFESALKSLPATRATRPGRQPRRLRVTKPRIFISDCAGVNCHGQPLCQLRINAIFLEDFPQLFDISVNIFYRMEQDRLRILRKPLWPFLTSRHCFTPQCLESLKILHLDIYIEHLSSFSLVSNDPRFNPSFRAHSVAEEALEKSSYPTTLLLFYSILRDAKPFAYCEQATACINCHHGMAATFPLLKLFP